MTEDNIEKIGIILLSPESEDDRKLCNVLVSLKKMSDSKEMEEMEPGDSLKETYEKIHGQFCSNPPKIEITDIMSTFGQFDFAVVVRYADIGSLKEFVLRIRDTGKGIKTITIPGIQLGDEWCKKYGED